MARRLIPFIESYCNRWCERCPLGHRCAVGATEQQLAGPEAELSDTIESLAFGTPEEDSSLSEFFKEPAFDAELLKFLAQSESEEVEEPRRTAKEERRESEPLILQARRCGAAIDQLVVKLKPYLQNYEVPYTDGFDWRKELLAEATLERLYNYYDILRWYRYPLEVKLSRALSGRRQHEEDEDAVQNDWNGSAKVVKLALGHCLGAARALLECEPWLEDELLVLLRELQKLDAELEEEFPRADEFIRPGFDTLGIQENLGV